jgi:hypothetical protein
MTPTHELRLDTMLRAMRDVVIPALPKEQKLAMDQAQTVLGYLRILRDQAGRTFQFAMVELREYAALVEALQEAASGADATQQCAGEARAAHAAVEPLLALQLPSERDVLAHVKALKSVADNLLRAAYRDGSEEFRRRADALVYGQSDTQLTRERVWLREAGFELEPERLPQMDVVLR